MADYKDLVLKMSPKFYMAFLQELRKMVDSGTFVFIHTMLFNTMTPESMIEYTHANEERLAREQAGDPMDLRLFKYGGPDD